MDTKALIINCTLKPSPETSNTAALIAQAAKEFEALGIELEVIRLVDHNILAGTKADEGERSGIKDDWPIILEKIRAADIFIIATPVWVGHISSMAQRAIERLDAVFHDKNLHKPDTGQYFPYGKVGGAMVDGSEDGAQACLAHLTWVLMDMGFTIPPNAEAFWVGEAGDGKSYIKGGGKENSYTNRMILLVTHNLAYFARLLKDKPIPTDFNDLMKKARGVSD